MSSGRRAISAKLRRKIEAQAGHRCGYCHSPQKLVLGPLEIEHIIPVARGGTDEEQNLWLACRLCNGYKGSKVVGTDPKTGEKAPLFNPRAQTWTEHFMWRDKGIYLNGITATGRATVITLKMNDAFAVMVRRHWMQAGWHPPEDDLIERE